MNEIEDPDTAAPNPKPFNWKSWKILPLTETSSTNEEARHQPIWTAVVADSQTAGRGRHGRHWTSDKGGLWLSAVLPTPGNLEHWNALPLAVGLAVIRTLTKLNITARMRWPNDIMVNDLKLAGLLLERYHSDRVVAGIGVNLTNNPGEESPELSRIATRLCDLTPSPPNRDEFMISLLTHLKEIHQEMDQGGVESLVVELNQMWGVLPRSVELDIQGKSIIGNFMGITPAGNLILQDAAGTESEHDAAHVTMLHEVPTTER
ncbi:MAG: biotin--[acetyl-CoA-carboxylase] ligase [Verrucomicrobiota bacterium]